MGNVLPVISMFAGLGAGTFAFMQSRRQPEKERQLRAMGAFFLGIAGAMLLLLFL